MEISEDRLRELFKEESSLKWIQEFLIFKCGIRNLNVQLRKYISDIIKSSKIEAYTPDEWADIKINELKQN